MKIVIYTSIFGDKDKLVQDQFQSDDIDYICFSDVSSSSTTWNVIPQDVINQHVFEDNDVAVIEHIRHNREQINAEGIEVQEQVI